MPVVPVAELPFAIELNGEMHAQWTASPEHPAALALGRLLCDGYLIQRADVLALNIEENPDSVVVRVVVSEERFKGGDSIRRAREALGARALPDLVQPIVRDNVTTPDRETLHGVFRELFANSKSDGVHTAALFSDSLEFRVLEVSRHNAVDKAIGLAFDAGTHLHGFGLVISSRISAEIAFKAARAGLAWVASRSVPSTLALDIAQTAGLPVVARAASPEFHVFLPAG